MSAAVLRPAVAAIAVIAVMAVSLGAAPAGATPWGGRADQSEAPAGRRQPAPPWFVVRYDVVASGDVRSDLAVFSAVVDDTLRDPNGWATNGAVAFVADRRDPDLTIHLAAPAVVAAADPACSAQYSCRVGDDVYINAGRWVRGADSYRHRGRSAYRQYVINHEVGHWLGLGHQPCSAPGAPAPIMKQQSKGLGGCEPRMWPLPQERR
ncbi:MAG TPA: DUF3152 domain-containing protein, partial [Egibacteraceae bacterium]|nr:DUF3152 domain-containing protein [Egibacteraceae bacterium]